MPKPNMGENYNNPYGIDNDEYMDLFKETKQKETDKQ